jgi:hypothetical protein
MGGIAADVKQSLDGAVRAALYNDPHQAKARGEDGTTAGPLTEARR